MQRHITHVGYMGLIHFDEHNGDYNKEDEEYTQGKKQVALVCGDVFCELFKHGMVIYLPVYLL
jgi:hypothetical protein